jgi:hypothetical protein
MRRLPRSLIPFCLLAFLPSCAERLPDRPDPPPVRGGAAPSSDDPLETLAREDPVGFLEECLRRYERDVTGYTLTMRKQECLGGQLQRPEVVRVAFREEPHSVFLEWLENPRLARRVVYVEGENDGKMLVLPKLLPFVVSREVEGDDARQSGRFTLKEFGLKKGMVRTLTSWQAARADGALFVEYLGEASPEEAGGRPCHVLRRSRYRAPENDGVTEVTVYADKDTGLQVGTVSKGDGGQVIGEYYFRDVCLNPEFEPGQFCRDALNP